MDVLDLTAFYQNRPPIGTSFDNTGTLTLNATTVTESTNSGQNVALLNSVGATITGSGLVEVSINNDGTITASGKLQLSGSVAGPGELTIGAGSTLITSLVTAGQNVTFGGTKGVLGLVPKKFLGAIGGFTSGQTIDLSEHGGQVGKL